MQKATHERPTDKKLIRAILTGQQSGPLPDNVVLTESEVEIIRAATATFNEIIAKPRTPRQQSIVMPKTKIQSKVRPQADAEFLLNAPELSIFVACLATINELRALVAEYDSGELSRIALSRRSTCAVAELREKRHRGRILSFESAMFVRPTVQ